MCHTQGSGSMGGEPGRRGGPASFTAFDRRARPRHAVLEEVGQEAVAQGYRGAAVRLEQQAGIVRLNTIDVQLENRRLDQCWRKTDR